jgi:hypothetical protein
MIITFCQILVQQAQWFDCLIWCSILMRRWRAKTILCSPSPLASSPYTVSGVFEEKVLVNRIECAPSLDSVYAALD